jgi:hypothetical protein
MCLVPGVHTIVLTDEWGYQGWRNGRVNITQLSYNEGTRAMEIMQLIVDLPSKGYTHLSPSPRNSQVVERSWTYTFTVLQPPSTVSYRGQATFNGTTGALLEAASNGPTLSAAAATDANGWRVVDAGTEGGISLVFLRTSTGLNLEEWRGRVGLTTDTGREQKWTLTDASIREPESGYGKIFIQSSSGSLLEDRHGHLGVGSDYGSYQMWTMTPHAASGGVGGGPGGTLRRSLLFSKNLATSQPTELVAEDSVVAAGLPMALLASNSRPYTTSNKGILTCQPGYGPIQEDRNECSTAAAALGLTFDTKVYYDWEKARPSGCFYHDSEDYLGHTVYFNPLPGGDRYGDDMRVCKLLPPPPSPPSPPSPPLPPLPPLPPPTQGPMLCLSGLHAEGVAYRAGEQYKLWVWGSKTYPSPDGTLAGKTATATSSSPSWSDSICVYASPVMDQCFEIRDAADDTVLNSLCMKLQPTAPPPGVVLFRSYKHLQLSGGASLAFFVSSPA